MPTKNLGRVSIVPSGTWNTSTVYNRLDAVVHDGSSWLAKKQNIGQMPVEGSDAWQLLAERGADGRQGVDGEPGKGLTIIGHFDTVESLEESVLSPDPGDAYSVGTAEPYDIYTYDGVSLSWFNNGPLQGLDGPQGPAGPAGPAGADGATGPQGPAGSDASVTADNIAAALSYTPGMVNPNLLDNWYFENPVNQREQTEYSENAYGIDRWKILSTHIMETTENGLKFTVYSAASVNYVFQQIIENFGALAGQTVTISALVVENTCNASLNFRFNSTLIGDLAAGSTGLISATYTIPASLTELNVGMQISDKSQSDGAYFVVKAIKLELGAQQTLAHQENGVWVLSEIPDFGEQLARCQRYFQRFNVGVVNKALGIAVARSSTVAAAIFNLSRPMRTHPTMTCTAKFKLLGDVSKTAITPVNEYAFTNMVRLNLTTSGLTANGVYFAAADSTGYMDFSADL